MLNDLKATLKKSPLLTNSYRNIRGLPVNTKIFLRKNLDLFKVRLQDIELYQLHKDFQVVLEDQKKSWPHFIYAWGYFYQGYRKIGITGVRETELRLKNYDMVKFLKPNMKVLDIGANAGFFALELSSHVGEVDAIEWNPYQVKLGELTKKFLKNKNVNFFAGDFHQFAQGKFYDAILSFANHHTTDGGMRPELRDYFKGLHDILNLHGILFFESHPQDVNDDFKAFMLTLNDLFFIREHKTVTDGELGGVRLFYVMEKR